MGRGVVVSRKKQERGSASATAEEPNWRVSPFPGVLLGGAGGTGGSSRVGELEQFGPWHGGFTGATGCCVAPGCESVVAGA